MKFFTENSPSFLHLKGLCDTLAQDTEFQEMRHNLSEFKKDEIAKKQLEALTAMGNVIRSKQSRKEELIPREVEEFEELRTEFLSNPIAAAFVESQENLVNVKRFISHFISKTIEQGTTPKLKEILDLFKSNQHCGTC
ncbi:MAG: YlbF family regulator [Verrucomicrobia bacterium]|nr:YlbF family regulator [Verrucomicrobiota bacterium]